MSATNSNVFHVIGGNRDVSMEAISEEKMAEYLVAWLESQHWDVYQEVRFGKYGGPIADIAAVSNDLLWVIECKTCFNFKVLQQADNWKVHFRSICIPFGKADAFASNIAHHYLHIGVLTVDMHDGSVDTFRDAPLMREYRKTAASMIGRLVPQQKTYAKAGTKSGGYYTPYKQTMEAVKDYICSHPGCTLREIMDATGKGHYRTISTARSCIAIALMNWEGSWCKIDTTSDKHCFRYYHKDTHKENT